jgi:hypothetical protein
MSLSTLDDRMSRTGWLRRIDVALSNDDVLKIARDYLATWPPEELARLPEDCRADHLSAMEDPADLPSQLDRQRVAQNFVLHVRWCAKYPLFSLAAQP